MYLSEIKMKEIQSKPGNNNWIFIYDRSGSMSCVLKKLGQDIVRLGKLLKVGDTLSLAYFSGQGQYRFVLKGFQITSDKTNETLEKVVSANISSIGLTCFSEALEDSIRAINDLKLVYPQNSFVLCFLTDGVPVPGGQKEEDAIIKHLGELRDLLGDALFVGYGDYYGKDLLSKMTAEVGGSFAHADDIEDFGKNVEVTIKNGRFSKKIEVDISNDSDVVLVFGKSNGQVKIYPHKDGKAFVSDSESRIYTVSSKATVSDNDDVSNVYAGAYSLASQGKIQDALEWLGKVGDKYLVDKLNNAFTTAETGDAIQCIHDATFDESKRMLDGYRKNYVPKADAFCVLDAIDTFIDDKEAYFYPSHSKWSYKRIGAISKVKEGYPKFIKDEKNKCSFSNLALNKKRLNLSVRTKINGFIEFNDGCFKRNIEKKFNTYQWRNYSIISDGALNVRKIPVSMSEDSFKVLRKGGLIKKTEKWVPGEIYVLDFKRIPIMNRSMAAKYSSAKELAELSLRENVLMASLKAMKYIHGTFESVSGLDYKVTPFTEQYTEDQLAYMFESGVRNDGSYGPPVEKEDTDDYYMARIFEIKVGGFSSIPSIESVKKKISENAKLNFVESIISDSLKKNDTDNIDELNKVIENTNTEIKEIRSEIQRAKFAIVLGKGKFDEFNSNEGEIETDSKVKVKFVFGEEKVKV